ncbi:uncharacterized protein LOC115589847 [Sparus aurata]|uniref:uncharacterized protein LOC115589847 n=1 Tax=Sparus aurata TaxID=8175 RepID=UPI0011C0E85D|nr:uncharacterized protein LOC115589847 [Sparus aurata]
MEVTALCSRLFINLLLMLVMQLKDCSYAQRAHGVFPRVVPTRLQFFEYEHISFYCEGFQRSLGWRLMKNISSENASCGTSWGFLKESVCIIRDVYVDDSGEYWCETGEGEKSGTVTISVTAGSVILESPVHPVTEGDHVTLLCKTRTPSSNISASFYKMASSSGAALLETSRFNMSTCVMKESTSAASLESESQQRAGSPSQSITEGMFPFVPISFLFSSTSS